MAKKKAKGKAKSSADKKSKKPAKVKKPEKRTAFAGRVLDPETGGYKY